MERTQITLKDVANDTGLSFQTVSRILNGNVEAHNDITRERVLTAARKLGYRRHSSARAIRHGRFESIALLLSEVPHLSLLSIRLRDGILNALATRENNLILARLPDTSLTSETRLPRILRELSSDGLLINYNDAIPEKMIALLKEHRMPAIWINSTHDVDCVYPDDREAGRLATRHLMNAGHRRIAYLHWSSGHYSQKHREEGYRKEMEGAGLEPISLLTFDIHRTFSSDQKGLPWLIGPERYTGFVCYSPEVASQLLFLTAMFGLRVSADLSAVTFADEPFSFLGFELDTVVLPYFEMGQEAVDMLQLKIEAPNDPLPPRILLPKVHVVGS